MCNLDAQGLFPTKEEFKREVEKHLTGHELVYFKIYMSQLPIIEEALEMATLMLGSDKSRGYCLEMICADFLAGARLQDATPETLIIATARLFKFLPTAQGGQFLDQARSA